MLSFSDLIRMQKNLPPECPLRLTPVINDPLAFIGDEKLEENVLALKSMLQATSPNDPMVKEAIDKINENFVLIKKAEAEIANLEKEAEGVFKGYECTARGALYQTERDISNTLWLEAFKKVEGIEIVFQLHSTLDRKTAWAQVLLLSKKSDARLEKALKEFDLKGWKYSVVSGPENMAYVLDKQMAGAEPDRGAMEAGLKVLLEVEAALAKKD